MKKLIFLSLGLIAFSLSSIAQSVNIGQNTPLEVWSQMWNTSNNYRNKVTKSNLGSQLDTAQAQTVKFSTSSWYEPTTTTDAFRVSPVNGGGTITIAVSAYKAQTVATSVNPTVVCSLYHSINGVGFTPVTGASVFTITPTSATVPTMCYWNIDKKSRFYQVWSTVAVDTAALRTDYYFLKPSTYSY